MSDKKYIELGKIIDAIMSIPVPADSYFAQITDAGKKLCVSVVQNVQSADVAPVVHGHWITVYREDGTKADKCSVCTGAVKYFDYKYGWCPHCGAKMDEKTGGKM